MAASDEKNEAATMVRRLVRDDDSVGRKESCGYDVSSPSGKSQKEKLVAGRPTKIVEVRWGDPQEDGPASREEGGWGHQRNLQMLRPVAD